MESCELVLLSNGSGWYEWSNFGGAFEMLRLQWKRPDPGQLAVLIQEYLGGTWTPGGLSPVIGRSDNTTSPEA